MSFTIRLRLAPPILCSTRTRIRDKCRLCRFSPGVNSPLRGFFSADRFRRHGVHILESPYLYPSACLEDKPAVRYRPFSSLGFCRDRFGSESQSVWFCDGQSLNSCPHADACVHYTVRRVLPYFSDVGVVVLCRQ